MKYLLEMDRWDEFPVGEATLNSLVAAIPQFDMLEDVICGVATCNAHVYTALTLLERYKVR